MAQAPGFEPEGNRASGGGRVPPGGTLSTRDWDPDSSVFDANVVALLRDRLGVLQSGIAEEQSYLDSLGPQGLTAEGVAVEIPAHWVETRGSPAYYLTVAEGYVQAAIQGTVCRRAHPPGSRAEHPPPVGQWCCDHVPPHCG